LWGLESHRRREAGDKVPYTIADAVRQMVKFRDPVPPRREWVDEYTKGLKDFRSRL
jgi:hypothetical protein